MHVLPGGQGMTSAPSRFFAVLDRAAPLAATAGIVAFVAVAILGFAKPPGSWMSDFDWYYAGGTCFLRGSSMYDLACFKSVLPGQLSPVPISGLAYPPHFAPFAVLFALPSLVVSKWLFLFVTLACTVALAQCSMAIARETTADGEAGQPLGHGWLIAILFGSSGMWAAVWLGQVTVVLVLCLWLGFRAIESGRNALGGALLSLATIKPQLALLVMLWVVLQGRAMVLAWALATAGLLGAYAALTIGPEAAVRGWLACVSAYQLYPVNALGDSSVAGIPSLLAVLGVKVPIWAATLVGVAVVILLRVRMTCAPFSPLALGTLLALEMLVHSRMPDYILLAPAFALFWPRSKWRVPTLLSFLFAAFIFALPQQPVMALIANPIAAHFRTVFAIAAFALLLARATRATPVIAMPQPAAA